MVTREPVFVEATERGPPLSLDGAFLDHNDLCTSQWPVHFANPVPMRSNCPDERSRSTLQRFFSHWELFGDSA